MPPGGDGVKQPLGSNGRAVIVALDHALASGQIAPLDHPQPLLAKLAQAQPDGLILTYGLLRHSAAYPLQRWLTADYYATSTLPGQEGHLELQAPLWNAPLAQTAGATGLKILLVFGRENPQVYLDNVRYIARLVEQAHQCNLLVMVEPVLWGSQIASHDQNHPHLIAHAARIAFELGADVVKVPIPSNPRHLEDLTRSLPVPVLLMGGPVTDPALLLSLIADALNAGASGVALGRNIWQHPQPAAMVLALKHLVHNGGSTQEALDILRGG